MKKKRKYELNRGSDIYRIYYHESFKNLVQDTKSDRICLAQTPLSFFRFGEVWCVCPRDQLSFVSCK